MDKSRFAVRSSAVAEDSQTSFAGQYLTVLNVAAGNILEAYKKVIASKYSPRAIFYRVNYGLSDAETPMAVLALQMIDAKTSGIIYTQDLDHPESAYLTIHSIWGLGELLVSGETAADILTVTKEEKSKIVAKKVGIKSQQMVYSQENKTDLIPLEDDEKEKISLDDATARRVARHPVVLGDRQIGDRRTLRIAVGREIVGRIGVGRSRRRDHDGGIE